MTSAGTAQSEVRRYPVRGALWGLLLGVGLALWAVLASVVTFGSWLPLVLIVVVCIAIGVAWSYLAPPKGAKDAPTRTAKPTPASSPAAEPEADDVTAPEAAITSSSGARATMQADPDTGGGSFSDNV